MTESERLYSPVGQVARMDRGDQVDHGQDHQEKDQDQANQPQVNRTQADPWEEVARLRKQANRTERKLGQALKRLQRLEGRPTSKRVIVSFTADHE